VNHLDAHGVIRAALLKSRHGAKKAGKTVTFRCPRHTDSTASAWLGDHAWGCSACGFTEHFATLAEVLGVELPKGEASVTGLTLLEYAERKGLALDGLARAGVHEAIGKFGDALVAMPYRRADGTTIRTKCRTRKGTFWMLDGEGTPLYGQDVLAAHPDAPVVIVEGESDCHAGWQRGLCVVGLPGASMWKADYSTLLAGRRVYVWQEPDEGGATLVAAVAASLPKALVIRDVKHRDTAIKDLCDLHQSVQQHGDEWAIAWREVVRQATPIGAEPPAVAFDALTGEVLDQILTEKLAPIDAVPTMLDAWNAVCGGGGGGVGLARGWYVTIGANSGTGKSLIGLNLALSAIRAGETVTVLSLEMSRDEMATRLLAMASGESVVALEQGPRFSVEAYRRAQGSLDQIRREMGGQVLVNRKPLSRLRDVESVIRYHHEQQGSRFFIVDYIQNIRTEDEAKVTERMEQVSNLLRLMALDRRIIVLSLSQFNRETSKNRAERPTKEGLMGGSVIENDSHQVLLFDHSRFTRTANLADTWLIVDKNRHGAVLDIPVRWDYRTLTLHPRALTTEESEAKHGRLTRQGRGW
jgi:KaiC/GvpD/RAD55 family RecA-like ATPase